MSGLIYRRAFENAYGLNLSTSLASEGANGSYSESDLATPMTKTIFDIIKVAVYIPPFSVLIGAIGTPLFINCLFNYSHRNERIILAAQLSRSLFCLTGLGFLLAPIDFAATISRKVRFHQDRNKDTWRFHNR
jgi:hypothetical protein